MSGSSWPLCLLILGCSGGSVASQPDAGASGEPARDGIRELLRTDGGELLADAAQDDAESAGVPVNLLGPGETVDAGHDSGGIDAECPMGWFNCDGEPGCEWDGCAMVAYPYIRKCGMCGETEVCACTPRVIRDREKMCTLDCE